MTIRNDNCGRQSACFGRGALAKRRAAAIALGVEFEYGGMVDEAVHRRHGHRRIGEDLVPRAEGLVAGRDQALALVTLDDELEQHEHSFGSWLAAAAKRLHHNVLATALANKLARIAWTVLA